MFASKRKSLTPGSSKSTSPVPPEFEFNDPMDNLINDNINEGTGVVGNNQEDDILQASALDGDTTLNPGIHYEYTNNHPMGKILIKILQDNTQMAKKAGLKSMELGIDDLCTSFYNAQLMERNRVKANILQTTAGIELSMIEKEMNSHTLNQQVEPPKTFSPVPTLLTSRQRADCMKLLPSGSHKFNGAPTGMNILEYLHMLKTMQQQCNLSLPEFYEMMLASTTGNAHMLLYSWIENKDDPTNIFHNLLVHFDKRLQPEEARARLYAYKAPKSADLAKVEATIQRLASRATSNMPPGIARTTSYNLEVISGLIKALPPASSLIVQNQNNEKSARLGEPLTAVQLSRVLNMFRHTIDKDIKLNGVSLLGDRKAVSRQGTRAGATKKYNTYKVSMAVPAPDPTNIRPPVPWGKTGPQPAPRQSFPRPTPIPEVGWGGASSRPPMTAQINQRKTTWRVADRTNRPSQMGNKYNNSYNKNNYNNKSNNKYGGKPRNPLGRFQKGPRPFPRDSFSKTDYCSLCGKTDHRAVDGCPNMVADNGRRVTILPAKDTCPACPAHVQPRLGHPPAICPYRKTGIWAKSA